MRNLIKKILSLSLLQHLESKTTSIKKFRSYKEALKHCSTNSYQDNELVEVVLEKTKRFKNELESDCIPLWDTSGYSLLSVINPIIENGLQKLNVLDFGGACGAHYFHTRKFINPKIKINWIVVETPTMVKAAKELENEELHFCDSLDEAIKKLEQIDLLHTSGTLQCVDEPYKYLDKILNSGSKWLLFNRLGLNQADDDVIVIHHSKLSWNGIGELPEGYKDRRISYPFTFISENKFFNKLNEKYKVFAKFSENSGIKQVKSAKLVGYGLLCRIKTFLIYLTSECELLMLIPV
jgi:putative methyltransferase (TIGR04325 family)